MKPNGFSLIELLVVIAIMAILIAIAYPNYQRYMQRARHDQAKVALSRAASRLAEYHTIYGTYQGASLSSIGLNSNEYYAFIVLKQSQDHFLITAQPIGSQKKQECAKLLISENGLGKSGACF